MTNPYDQAQRMWDERFAFHAQQAKIATRLAVALVLVCLALSGVIVWQAMHRTYVPYVVMVDDLGRPTLANPPQLVSDWPEAVVLREVSEIVQQMRGIPGDEAILRQAWEKLVVFTASGTAGHRKIFERGRSKVGSPFVLQNQLTVEVEVRSVLYQGGNTWLSEWAEITRDRTSGRFIHAKRYQGSFQLAKLGSVSPEVLTVNPLGIQIQDYDIRLLGENG